MQPGRWVCTTSSSSIPPFPGTDTHTSFPHSPEAPTVATAQPGQDDGRVLPDGVPFLHVRDLTWCTFKRKKSGEAV